MITIPGLKMPKNCLDCPFADHIMGCLPFAAINGSSIYVAKNIDKRHYSCPLKERSDCETLKSALTQIGKGNFGAVDIPAHTGDIFLALKNYVNKALNQEEIHESNIH
jgi:hypothetical protein